MSRFSGNRPAFTEFIRFTLFPFKHFAELTDRFMDIAVANIEG
ncbi:uncharacterized protein METZ01_LOCUS409596, partial [marine metagenome]